MDWGLAVLLCPLRSMPPRCFSRHVAMRTTWGKVETKSDFQTFPGDSGSWVCVESKDSELW